MDEVQFHLLGGRDHYVTGETVSGQAELVLPLELEPETLASAIQVSLHCVGEVKWVEQPSTPYYLDGHIYYEDVDYYEQVLKLEQKDLQVQEHLDHRRVQVPFSFLIPVDKNLPSTMTAELGFIRYFLRVTVKLPSETKKFTKDLVVQAPMDRNLMVTVGGSAEKVVLFHSGTVSMNASIGRKAFASGQNITVHLSIDNKTNALVTPRATLHQVQVYMSGTRHKTVEQGLTEQPVTGEQVQPHSVQPNAVLEVPVPVDLQPLSIKSSLITVKYFVHVTLDIPHSLDLHVNLPVVITTQAVVDKVVGEGKAQQQQGSAAQHQLINL